MISKKMKPNTEQIIIDIQQELDCGMRVYLHKNHLIILTLPDADEIDFMEDEDWQQQKKELKVNQKNYVEIEKWDSSYSFKIMKSFVESLGDNHVLKEKLFEVLERAKPFRNFRSILDEDNDSLQNWYHFKSSKEREFVKNQLSGLKMSD